MPPPHHHFFGFWRGGLVGRPSSRGGAAKRGRKTRRGEKAPTMAQPEQGGGVGFLDTSAPLEVVLGILRRLPARTVLRLRVVCRAWRNVASLPAVLAVLHRLQPPRPLLCFGLPACPDRHIRLKDYCVEALDLRSDELRSIFRVTDNTYCITHHFVDDSHKVAPIDDFVLNYGAYEKDDHECTMCGLTVHASLDGLLLVSFKHAWYVCNPATRQWAATKSDISDRVVLAFYFHGGSGEYRVLGRTGKHHKIAPMCFCVYSLSLALAGGPPITRVLGDRPISRDAAQDMGLHNFGLDPAGLSPPVQRRSKLHWPPQQSQGYHIPVFDTEAQRFSWMRPPPRIGTDMSLLEIEGKIAMSVSWSNTAMLELWRLEDYEREIWVWALRIQLPVEQMTDLNLESWSSSVVSPEGDVLIESPHWVLHCDRNGQLLQKFWFPDGAAPVRHGWRESLDMYAIFRAPRTRDAPPFYSGL